MTVQPLIYRTEQFTDFPSVDVSRWLYPIRYYARALPSVFRKHELRLDAVSHVYRSHFKVSAKEQRQWFELFGVNAQEGAKIPFTYLTTTATLAFMEILSALGVNPKYLRHLRSEIDFVAGHFAVEPDHRYQLYLHLNDITAIEEDRILIEIDVRIYDEQDHLCAKHTEYFHIANLNKDDVRRLDASPAFNRRKLNELSDVRAYTRKIEHAAPMLWKISKKMGTSYGRVSGDMNIVHTTFLAARLMGYPRPFIQGFCIVNHMLKYFMVYQQKTLHRSSVTMVRPIFVGDVVKIYTQGQDFEIVNSADKVVAYGKIQ